MGVAPEAYAEVSCGFEEVKEPITTSLIVSTTYHAPSPPFPSQAQPSKAPTITHYFDTLSSGAHPFLRPPWPTSSIPSPSCSSSLQQVRPLSPSNLPNPQTNTSNSHSPLPNPRPLETPRPTNPLPHRPGSHPNLALQPARLAVGLLRAHPLLPPADVLARRRRSRLAQQQF